MLYVPGDQPALLGKALERGADALIVDLEDAVAPNGKVVARDVVSDWLKRNESRADAIWVRINAGTPEEDIAAIVAPVAGVMVPSAETALLVKVDGLLTAAENRLGLERGSFRLIPLIETANGLLSAVNVASLPRVTQLAIGRADLAGELGLSVDPEGPEFRTIILQLVIASSAAGIAAPLAPTSTDFRDLVALRASTVQLMKLGCRGRTAVHPAQLAVINEVFTPTAEEVRRAVQLVTVFEESERGGTGVVVGPDGTMVDAAVVRSARDILSRASFGEA